MPGRKPKPTRLKILAGNPGHKKLNKNEPQPEIKRPQRPKFLSKAARKIWNKTVPQLERMGILAAVDGNALGMYCQCVARLDEAEALINEYGQVIREPIVAKGEVVGHSLKKNPACTVAKDMLQQARAFGSLFGLSPSDRSKISIAPPEDEKDPLRELEKRRAAQMQTAAPAQLQ